MPFDLMGPQYKQLRDAIVAAFDEADFSDFLLFNLNMRYDVHSSGPNYNSKIVSILKYLVNERRITEFVTKAAAEKPHVPTWQELVTEFTVFAQPAGDPYEVCCLSGSHIMVNRARLRAALRDDLCKPSGKRILVIKGSPQSGKSHSLQLLAHLQTALGRFELVHVDLEECTQMAGLGSINAEDLAGYIINQMDGYEKSLPPDPTDTQHARWIIKFCNEIEKKARTDTRQWWVVIDGFNKVLLPPPTRDLIKAFANRVNLTLANFRIVLIGYSDTFLPAVEPHVIEEQIVAFGTEELWEFFDKAFTERKLDWKSKTVEEKRKDIQEAVTAVLTKVDQTKAGYMYELSITTSRELRKRLSGASNGNSPRSPS
jgi:hypothetical protein